MSRTRSPAASARPRPAAALKVTPGPHGPLSPRRHAARRRLAARLAGRRSGPWALEPLRRAPARDSGGSPRSAWPCAFLARLVRGRLLLCRQRGGAGRATSAAGGAARRVTCGRGRLAKKRKSQADRTDREPDVAPLDQPRPDAAPDELASPAIKVATHRCPGPGRAPSDATDLEHRRPPTAAPAAEEVHGRHRDRAGGHEGPDRREGRRRSPGTGRCYPSSRSFCSTSESETRPSHQSPAATDGAGGSSSPRLRSLHRPIPVSPRSRLLERRSTNPEPPTTTKPRIAVIG